MQVTTGTAKGHKLKSVPGDTTRPVMDRVKQAVFNILGDDVRGTHWLDAFAGTGAIGIEALSRGAATAVFVDLERAAIQTIEANLASTKLGANTRVLRQDSLIYLGGQPNQAFDFIYIAPPQYKGLWSKALTLIDNNPGWLAEDADVIVQIDPREYEQLPLRNLEQYDERRYGRTLVVFYQRTEAPAA